MSPRLRWYPSRLFRNRSAAVLATSATSRGACGLQNRWTVVLSTTTPSRGACGLQNRWTGGWALDRWGGAMAAGSFGVGERSGDAIGEDLDAVALELVEGDASAGEGEQECHGRPLDELALAVPPLEIAGDQA